MEGLGILLWYHYCHNSSVAVTIDRYIQEGGFEACGLWVWGLQFTGLRRNFARILWVMLTIGLIF